MNKDIDITETDPFEKYLESARSDLRDRKRRKLDGERLREVIGDPRFLQCVAENEFPHESTFDTLQEALAGADEIDDDFVTSFNEKHPMLFNNLSNAYSHYLDLETESEKVDWNKSFEELSELFEGNDEAISFLKEAREQEQKEDTPRFLSAESFRKLKANNPNLFNQVHPTYKKYLKRKAGIPDEE